MAAIGDARHHVRRLGASVQTYPRADGENLRDLFALIMVLTFTCSFSVAGAGREQVRTMLIGALGCNLAWGIIDAVFYLMGSFGAQVKGS